MNPSDSKGQLKLIDKLLAEGPSDRISLAPGLPATGSDSKSVLWGKFQRVKVDGKMCQVIRCKECDTVMIHRAGTPYDHSVGRSSGNAPISRHLCPKTQASQPPITALLKKIIPDGVKRTEKKAVSEALSSMCVEDMRPFSVVEGEPGA